MKLTSLNGYTVGFLISSSYVEPVGFYRGGNIFVPAGKKPRCLQSA
jgi:hypothetical protein